MIAEYISGRRPPPEGDALKEQLEIAERIRAQMGVDRPQFPHGDYVGMVSDLASDLNLLPPDEWRRLHPVLIPADFGPHREEARILLEKDLAEFSAGKHMPAVICSSLAGSQWSFERSLVSRIPTMPSGTVTGTASFTTIFSNESGDKELLFSEQGSFVTDSGLKLEVSAFYVYVYSAEKDSLEIFFADKETHSKKDYLFVPLKLQASATGWTASAFHRCSADGYQAEFTFAMKGLKVREIVANFDVSGPHKDYFSHTIFKSKN